MEERIGGVSEISPTRIYLKGKGYRLNRDMPVENPFLYRITSIVLLLTAPPLEHSRCFLKTKSCSACLYSRIKGNIISYHRSIECSSTHMIAFDQQRKELFPPALLHPLLHVRLDAPLLKPLLRGPLSIPCARPTPLHSLLFNKWVLKVPKK